jgi:hypothetical protein
MGVSAYRRVEGSKRICHEMAKQNSPGLQPWVRQPPKIALKVATERGVLLSARPSVQNRCAVQNIQPGFNTAPFGRHFRAVLLPL